MRIEPFRIIADDPGRGTAEINSLEPRALLLGERARGKTPAVGKPCNGSRIQIALKPQHAEEARARLIRIHQVGGGRLAAQRIVNETSDRCAVAEAGKA